VKQESYPPNSSLSPPIGPETLPSEFKEEKKDLQPEFPKNVPVPKNVPSREDPGQPKYTSTTSTGSWAPKKIEDLREDQDHSSIDYKGVKGFWEQQAEDGTQKQTSEEEEAQGRKRKRETEK
jgi:hypothetical protein